MTNIAIASGSKISADAGAAIAAQGGNAVDAAIAGTLVSMCTDLGVMAPGAGAAPSDAIVLFDGSNLDAWRRIRTGENYWNQHTD